MTTKIQDKETNLFQKNIELKFYCPLVSKLALIINLLIVVNSCPP
ncbi:MAG TPA: hypothetical protein PKY81_12000 [bacterium]|nr:hypothetical protein [bacterium]HPN31667.1 hypothetical protein [bacterium]